MSEFQEFIQRQTQAAEAELNVSLKSVITEWKNRSESIIYEYESLLDNAKTTIQSDIGRIEKILTPFEKNIEALSESVSVSKSVQSLLQEHIQSSIAFGAQLESYLGEVLHAQNTGIIPQLELHEQSLKEFGAQLKSSLAEIIHAQTTGNNPHLELH